MRYFLPNLCKMFLLLAVVPAAADSLKLNGLFRDNMVIQRDTEARVWGWGDAGEQVEVTTSWNGKKATTKVEESGQWSLFVKTPGAGGPHRIEVESGDQSITIKNVLAGEVWICGGQSNMQWRMRGFGPDHWKDEAKKAKYPEIRYALIPQVRALEPLEDVKTKWEICNPRSVMGFSAIAYFFGSRLHEELDVPIGLISSNWGGSSAEAWVSPEVLMNEFPEFQDRLMSYPKTAQEHGSVFPLRAKAPKWLKQTSPSVLFNGMIAPIVPFAMKGVIWYQGESNVKKPAQYRDLFPAVISDWRNYWGQGNFPFYYVQIAPFAYKAEPIPVAFLREAQLQALSVPNTGMVVTMDVGEVDNIHPKRKKPVAERLALLALANDYGKDVVASGPLLESSSREGNKMRLKFTNVGSGLTTNNGEELTHFTIAGRDKKFHPAQAVIEGDTVVVRSDEVSQPVAVRFGWGNADITNFVNEEGLPASSFRTDDWPIEKK